jgi:hypothetical protein
VDGTGRESYRIICSEISDTEPLGSEITDTESLGSEITDTEPLGS